MPVTKLKSITKMGNAGSLQQECSPLYFRFNAGRSEIRSTKGVVMHHIIYNWALVLYHRIDQVLFFLCKCTLFPKIVQLRPYVYLLLCHRYLHVESIALPTTMSIFDRAACSSAPTRPPASCLRRHSPPTCAIATGRRTSKRTRECS